MKKNKLLIVVAVFGLICALGLSVFATVAMAITVGEKVIQSKPIQALGLAVLNKGADVLLSEEQKTELRFLVNIVLSGEQEVWMDMTNGDGVSEFGVPVFGQGMSDEEKEHMEKQRALLQEKWNALSDSQKEELYVLYDEAIDAQIAIIDKRIEWGLIDETAARTMREKLRERKTAMRDNGEFGLFGGGVRMKVEPVE